MCEWILQELQKTARDQKFASATLQCWIVLLFLSLCLSLLHFCCKRERPARQVLALSSQSSLSCITHFSGLSERLACQTGSTICSQHGFACMFGHSCQDFFQKQTKIGLPVRLQFFTTRNPMCYNCLRQDFFETQASGHTSTWRVTLECNVQFQIDV